MRMRCSDVLTAIMKLGKKADDNAKAAEKADKEYQKNVEILRNIQEKTFRVDMPKIIKVFIHPCHSCHGESNNSNM